MHAIITGRDHSEEAALLGDIGNQYKVPVFSISASLPLHVKTPSFFVQMTNDYASQMKCITSLVQNFGWKNVIAVYEDDGYGSTTSSMLDTLSLSLQDIGSRIEDRLAFPPVAFMPHPKEMIRDELIKVIACLNLQSYLASFRNSHIITFFNHFLILYLQKCYFTILFYNSLT